MGFFFLFNFLQAITEERIYFGIPRSPTCLTACFTWLAALLLFFFYLSVWHLAPDTMFRSANLLLRQAVTHESIGLYQRI